MKDGDGSGHGRAQGAKLGEDGAVACQVGLAAAGTVVHLKGYGSVKVLKLVASDGDIEYWATNVLEMDELQRMHYAKYIWTIESYHRGIK